MFGFERSNQSCDIKRARRGENKRKNERAEPHVRMRFLDLHRAAPPLVIEFHGFAIISKVHDRR
jgi:hypothetical protein